MHISFHHIFDILWILLQELFSVHLASVIYNYADPLVFKYLFNMLGINFGKISTHNFSLNVWIVKFSFSCYTLKIGCSS